MKAVSGAFLVLVVATISSPQLQAQTCLGLPAASISPRNLTFAATFPEDQSVFGVRLGGIRSSGAFGGIGASYYSFDQADELGDVSPAFSIEVDVGRELSLATESAVRVCPIASATALLGPNFEVFGDEIKSRSFLGTVGGSIGATIAASPGFSLVPFGSLALVYFNTRASFAGESESESDTGGQLTAGLGLSFSDRIIVRPTVSKGFGFDGESDEIFGISVSLPLGRR